MNKFTHLLTLVAALAAPAWAQVSAADHAAHHAAPDPAAGQTEGEVRKVDKAAGKITLKHGEIKALDMPPMTMVFAVADQAMLDAVKVGDKVRFKAVNDGGKLTVVDIRLAN